MNLQDFSPKNYRAQLFEELTRRRQKNAGYSLRAFARDLGVSATALSEVLSQKRNFSAKNVEKVVLALRLGNAATYLKGTLQGDRLTRPAPKKIQRELIESDKFALIADWYHYAILSLASLKANRADAHWLASRLNIEVEQAQEAVNRLIRMGLLQLSNGKLHRSSLPIQTTIDIPADALKKHHSQNLKLAEKSLHRDSVLSREFCSITLSVDPRKLVEAKKIMRDALEIIDETLSEGDHKEVYTVAMQMFPVTELSE